MVMTIGMYVVAFACLGVSFLRDRGKTVAALRKAWRAFENILPQFLSIIVLVGIAMALLDTETISRIIGAKSGWLGTVGAALIGSITLIPGFVAFPTAALLLQNGAGYVQIGAFVSTLMMVGVLTFPVERKYFGMKLALLRNGLAFAFSFLVAVVIGWVCAL